MLLKNRILKAVGFWTMPCMLVFAVCWQVPPARVWRVNGSQRINRPAGAPRWLTSGLRTWTRGLHWDRRTRYGLK